MKTRNWLVIITVIIWSQLVFAPNGEKCEIHGCDMDTFAGISYCKKCQERLPPDHSAATHQSDGTAYCIPETDSDSSSRRVMVTGSSTSTLDQRAMDQLLKVKNSMTTVSSRPFVSESTVSSTLNPPLCAPPTVSSTHPLLQNALQTAQGIPGITYLPENILYPYPVISDLKNHRNDPEMLKEALKGNRYYSTSSTLGNISDFVGDNQALIIEVDIDQQFLFIVINSDLSGIGAAGNFTLSIGDNHFSLSLDNIKRFLDWLLHQKFASFKTYVQSPYFPKPPEDTQ